MDDFKRTLYNSNIEQKSFSHTTHVYHNNQKFYITELTDRDTSPDVFKYNLTPPQLASLWVMNQIERYKSFESCGKILYHSAAILSNDLGSGKTCVLLALITKYPVPTNGPVYPIHIDTTKASSLKSVYHSGVRPVVTKEFRTVLRPALVFVGYSVLSQWENEVKKFNPNLNMLVVDDIYALKKFYRLLRSKKLNNYHIVIIKNKIITGSFPFDYGEIDKFILRTKSKKDIYNVVSAICRDYCFTRVIVDDFDTIKVPPVAGNINALFTWFVSCTRNKIARKSWVNIEHDTVESLLFHNNIVYGDITSNDILYNIHNVCVHPSFQKKYANVGRPEFYYYVFTNPSGKVMDLIGIMAGDKVNEIMEALNGDAIDEAARIAGIETSDPNAIFKALLQKNYDQWVEAKRVLDLFENYFDKIDIKELPPMTDNPDQDDTYTRKHLRSGRPVEWRYPGLKQLFDEERERQKQSFKEANIALEKFKYSVGNNECQVCALELNDPDENYCIMPCCHEIIHAECALQGCQFQKIQNEKGYVISGRCPFNKTHVVLYNQLCYIKGGFDLGSIDEKSFDKKSETEVAIPAVDVKPKDRTKYDAIVEIINGTVPTERKKIDLHIPALMECKDPLPPPYYAQWGDRWRHILDHEDIPESYHTLLLEYLGCMPRVLVFANFDQTLDRLESHFGETGVRYERLRGNQSQLNAHIANFQSGKNNVLLINSTRHCSGLNLQMATDLVFGHRIENTHHQSQVTGRIQREGRTCNAKIHFCLYDNELIHLKKMER